MKMKTLMANCVVALASATPALAAQVAREDHSGLVVWLFLGFCALIVLAQLMPALMLLFGMIKGLLSFKGKSQHHPAKLSH